MIKKHIKNIVSLCISSSMAEMNKKVSEYSTVSFDVFDTLLFRNCENPTDIFRLVQRKYNFEYPDTVITNFSEIRRTAELKARKMKDKEIVLDDIYKLINSELGEKAECLKRIEIETEINMCVPNEEIVSFFRELLKSGKRVFLISDMYLPCSVIEKMLKKCGICDYEKLYVSGEYGVTKFHGGLYDQVALISNIEKKSWIHIGDGLRSDYFAPRAKGIRSVLVRRDEKNNIFFRNLNCFERRRLSTDEIFEYGVLKQISVNSREDDDIYAMVGNQVLGPILYGYCVWLHKWTEKEKIDRICFLSREGYIMKRFYETLYPESTDKNVYLYISRLSISRAMAINTTSFEELIDNFATVMKEVYSVGDFLKLIGLQCRITEICKCCCVTPELSLDKVDSKLFYNEIMKYGKDYFLSQNKLFLKYLSDMELVGMNLAVADIGWVGTMQLKLQSFLPKSVIQGFYIANSDVQFRNCREYDRLVRHGFFCESNEWNEKGQKLRFTQTAIETLFMNSEGSTIEYYDERYGVVPILDMSQTDNSFLHSINAVDSGALQYAKSIVDANVHNYLADVNPDACFKPYYTFALYPTKRTIEFFSSIHFFDGVKKSKLLPQHGLGYYFFHIRECFDEFEKNGCKVLWLKCLFKLKLPYYRMLLFMVKRIKAESKFRKKYIQ